MTPWSLRYTSHLGYRPPFRMQFEASVGSQDPVAHVEYAAQLGLSGVLYPWALDRSESEVDSVGAALKANGLAAGVVVGVPAAVLGRALWTDPASATEGALEEHTLAACRAANRVGSGVIGALICDPNPDASVGRAIEVAAPRLARMAGLAADHGIKIGVEAMVNVPSSVLRSNAAAIELVRGCDHPSVGIIFDTGHSASMGEDVRAAFELVYDEMVVMQFAAGPNRLEPTRDDPTLVAIGSELIHRNWDGLVDLEHGWTEESRAGELAGLRRIGEFDDVIGGAPVPGPAPTA